MHRANEQLKRRLLLCWCAAVLAYFFCLFFRAAAAELSAVAAAYVPSIAALSRKDSFLGGFAGIYFGVTVFLLPAMALALLWRQQVDVRVNYWARYLGRSRLKTAGIIYLFAVPGMILLFFGLAVVEPTPTHERHLFGQLVGRLAVSTHLGLLVLGSLFVTVLVAFLSLVLAYIWLPFAALLSLLRTGDDM